MHVFYTSPKILHFDKNNEHSCPSIRQINYSAFPNDLEVAGQPVARIAALGTIPRGDKVPPSWLLQAARRVQRFDAGQPVAVHAAGISDSSRTPLCTPPCRRARDISAVLAIIVGGERMVIGTKPHVTPGLVDADRCSWCNCSRRMFVRPAQRCYSTGLRAS